MLAVISRQDTWVIILVPLLGLTLSVLVLYRLGLTSEMQGSQRPKWAAKWRSFPPGAARSHLTDDMVTSAGVEERFPWRLTPLRLLAICATVGLGGPMGTEAPAAYLGVATGSALGTPWRRLLRPAAVGGGAAGVAVLMGIPLVGIAYILELGRRHNAPLNVERVTAALAGGIVGWLLNSYLGVNLIRLVVPKEPPHSYEVLGRLEEFADIGRPLVVGASRKGFLTRGLGREVPPLERDWATAATVAAAVAAGAHIIRVHAVREMVQVARVADEIRKYHRASS